MDIPAVKPCNVASQRARRRGSRPLALPGRAHAAEARAGAEERVSHAVRHHSLRRMQIVRCRLRRGQPAAAGSPASAVDCTRLRRPELLHQEHHQVVQACRWRAWSYVKQQCMHCVDPTCVAGCSFFALTRILRTAWSRGSSTVYGLPLLRNLLPIPRAEISVVGNQSEDREVRVLSGPPCRRECNRPVPACPTHAVIFGTREELLKEAKSRVEELRASTTTIAYTAKPTAAARRFSICRTCRSRSWACRTRRRIHSPKYMKWQQALYSFLVVPTVLYATMVGVIRGNWNEHKHHMDEDQKKTGLRPQL